MTWHDSLLWADASDNLKKKASFRGAKFFIQDVDTSVGRRNVSHQYPLRDEPYIEDLGMDIDDFVVNGYVIQNSDNGADYIPERNALIEALKKPGPGTLIHPFYGEKFVSLIGKAKISERFSPGGIARFSMTFAKASDTSSISGNAVPYPKKTSSPIKDVDEAYDDSVDFANDGFAGGFNNDDVPDFVSESSLGALASLNKMLRSVIKSIQGAGPAQKSRALTILSEQYDDINNLTTLADTCGLANGIVGMSNGLLSLIGQYGDIVVSQLLGTCSSAVRGINNGPWSGAQVDIPATAGYSGSTMSDPAIIAEDFGKTVTRASLAINAFGAPIDTSNPSQYGGQLETIMITTASRARQAANQTMIINMARLTALLTAAKAAIRISYTSHDAVVEMMNEVLAEIDILLLKLGNDAANTDYAAFGITISDPNGYQALRSFRPVFVSAMLATGASLADIIEYEVPPQTTSSLALAYDQYEDLGREKEIISRNVSLIKNPGFLPGGQTLEILSE